jgi:hypothetical protein
MRPGGIALFIAVLLVVAAAFPAGAQNATPVTADGVTVVASGLTNPGQSHME